MKIKNSKTSMIKSIRISILLLLVLLLTSYTPLTVFSDDEVHSINSSGGENKNCAVDPSQLQENYTAVLYDNTNGLPTSEANDIVEASDGTIWIGSYSGLIRYDGKDFERMDSTTGITSVKCLFIDSQDRLWIGTNDNGVALLENGEFTMWGMDDGLRSASVRCITEDSQGTIYVATTEGLVMIDSENRIHIPIDPRIKNAYIYELRIGNDGLIYGITNSGEIFTMDNGKVIHFRHNKGNLIKEIGCILPDPAKPGYIYIEKENSQIYHGTIMGISSDKARTIDISPLFTGPEI